jgi:hypothetical protein
LRPGGPDDLPYQLDPVFNVLKASADPTTSSTGPVLSVNTTAPINTLVLTSNGDWIFISGGSSGLGRVKLHVVLPN